MDWKDFFGEQFAFQEWDNKRRPKFTAFRSRTDDRSVFRGKRARAFTRRKTVRPWSGKGAPGGGRCPRNREGRGGVGVEGAWHATAEGRRPTGGIPRPRGAIPFELAGRNNSVAGTWHVPRGSGQAMSIPSCGVGATIPRDLMTNSTGIGFLDNTKYMSCSIACNSTPITHKEYRAVTIKNTRKWLPYKYVNCEYYPPLPLYGPPV